MLVFVEGGKPENPEKNSRRKNARREPIIIDLDIILAMEEGLWFPINVVLIKYSENEHVMIDGIN